MRSRLLKPADYLSMPWKNGKGSTLQIAIQPPGASLAANDFDWRFSSAEIREDGPFSSFPGCRRWLALLEGPELMVHAGETIFCCKGESVACFEGEESASGRLPSGPVRDLNLIVRKGTLDGGLFLSSTGFQRQFTCASVLLLGMRGRSLVKVSEVGEWSIGPMETLLLECEDGEPCGLTAWPEAGSALALAWAAPRARA
jgi:uncharacterized protein